MFFFQFLPCGIIWEVLEFSEGLVEYFAFGPGFFPPVFGWEILITTCFSLEVENLFTFLILSWFNFGRLYISRNPSMSFRFSSLGEYRFLNYVLIILWVSLMSVVAPLFPYIILIGILSFFLLVNLAKGLSVLLIFLKEPALFFSLDLFFLNLFLFY